MAVIKDLGLRRNLDVVNEFVALPGKFVIDAGCGALEFSREIAAQGARVLAIDPDPEQATKNLAALPIKRLEFVETGAEELPLARSTVDGVFFVYSLHHIPKTLCEQVFDEVLRVIRPGGFLYVLEPSSCPINDVMKLFHDEDEARDAARQAVRDFAVPAFESMDEAQYHTLANYSSFEDFADHFINKSFNSLYDEGDVRHPNVRAAFERLGQPNDGQPNYQFEAKKQVTCLRGKY